MAIKDKLFVVPVTDLYALPPKESNLTPVEARELFDKTPIYQAAKGFAIVKVVQVFRAERIDNWNLEEEA